MMLFTLLSRKYLCVGVMILLLVAPFIASADQKLINFAVLANSKVKEQVYRDRVREFEAQHPNITVRLIRLASSNYPDLVNELMSIKDEVDVINWFASNRLKTLIERGVVVNINEFWQEHHLDDNFSQSSKDQVSVGENVYGIPLTSYIWGFYYKKSLFNRLNLVPPATWPEFITLLDTLNNHNISPIALGTKYPWQIAGWFDYLMLRLHGAQKYQQLVKGEIAFDSKEVKLVFNYWKNLLNNKYIFAQHRFFDGDELMPLLYREVVGINLIGSFSLSSLSEKYQQDIGFFPFPTITIDGENSVLAPMSIIALTQHGSKKSYLNKFLTFFDDVDTQIFINKKLSTFSPNKSARVDKRPIIEQTAQIFENADYQSQYFDLEFDFEMAEFAKRAFSDFITHQNVQKVTTELEQKRQQLYSQSNK